MDRISKVCVIISVITFIVLIIGRENEMITSACMGSIFVTMIIMLIEGEENEI